MKTQTSNSLPFRTATGALLALLYLALLPACGHHQPASVEDHSTISQKRQMNTDGTYIVRSGDTLYAIAFNYGMDTQDVAKWNEISSPYVIYPGQKLRLTEPPAGIRPGESSSAVQISTAQPAARAKTRTLSEPAKSAQATSTVPKTVAGTAKSTAPVKTPAKPLAGSNADPESWKWPTRGRVLRSYVAGDPARNGLDIAGKEGQAINASAAGLVVYSGNGLIGYGELIIIKHSEKMLSAYAHNKIRLAMEGDRVSAGQKIAEMGRNAGNEQILHFEIRARGKPVNPLIYLSKK